ncbi:TTLL8_2 [Blepharisma stoltei]|uniref:Tubulin-tyrosine ligase n=1 Tax=Blepharisma stoltei TaxID=1481888 RepID=A0AAU9IT88_9CILI|nr:unnamed protein product [Blepharisma stoltei]
MSSINIMISADGNQKKTPKRISMTQSRAHKKSNNPDISAIKIHETKIFEEEKISLSFTPNFSFKKNTRFQDAALPYGSKIKNQFPLLKTIKSINKKQTGTTPKHIPAAERLFVADIDYPDIVSCLKSRGWRECNDLNRDRFTLKFVKNAKLPDYIRPNQIINHIAHINELSTKVKICRNLKKFPISYDFFPECYIVGPKDSPDEFIEAFKKNEAESVLKLYKENASQVVSDDLIKALKFLQKKLSIEEKNQENADKQVEDCLRMLETDKQYSIHGTKNIWIVKPGFKSRGRDILLYRSLDDILEYTKNNSWVIQKYIENPLIINKRKFDIRQWVLITCFNTFEIFFYKKCYLRFSVKEYDLSEIDDLYIHLTNNSIAKYSPSFKAEDSMWHIDQFIEWLIEENKDDIWNKTILPDVKNIIINTAKSAKAKISAKKNTFELLGFDFMIDSNFRPWLIEVNTSPAMDYSTNITEELVKKVLPDTMKVILDLPCDPNASIGDFEKIASFII